VAGTELLRDRRVILRALGNSNAIPKSLLAPAQTVASLIANEFAEATEPFHASALLAAAVVLLVIAVLVNTLARALVWSVSREAREAA